MLTCTDQKQLNKQYTDSAEAYQLLLKGRYFWNKAMNKKALEYYQQAIDKDPNYAQAYDGLADCYLGLADLGVISAEDGYSKAKLAATTAMALDNSLAEPHTSLAQVKLSYDW